MATIVNTTPGTESSGNSGMSMVLGFITILILAFLFLYYGLPALRGAAGSATNNGASINVPEQVDVNVNTPENPAQ